MRLPLHAVALLALLALPVWHREALAQQQLRPVDQAAVRADFWARVAHALAYTFAVPWARTLAFAAGFAAQAVIAWRILVPAAP